jgi:hypothetical protein
MFKETWQIVVAVLAIWAALAQIAPKLFSVEADRQTVMSWLIDPAVSWVAGAAVAVWIVITLGSIQKAITGLGRALTELAARIPSAEAPQSLGPDEMEHSGMLWKWNGHDATGPFCLKHRQRLGYESASGVPVKFLDFEASWLAKSGWFICPADDQMFILKSEHQQVQTLRAKVKDRFRLKFQGTGA